MITGLKNSTYKQIQTTTIVSIEFLITERIRLVVASLDGVNILMPEVFSNFFSSYRTRLTMLRKRGKNFLVFFNDLQAWRVFSSTIPAMIFKEECQWKAKQRQARTKTRQ